MMYVDIIAGVLTLFLFGIVTTLVLNASKRIETFYKSMGEE
jgi:VIT1/CCC1 family predicted Fe2+/Mn2+ transporter